MSHTAKHHSKREDGYYYYNHHYYHFHHCHYNNNDDDNDNDNDNKSVAIKDKHTCMKLSTALSHPVILYTLLKISIDPPT